MTLTFYVGRKWNIFITSSGMLPSSHMFFHLPFSLIWFPHGNPRKDKHIYYICNPVFKAVQRTTKFKMNYSEELSAYTVYTVVYPSGLNMCVLTPPFYMCWKILGRCRIKGKKKIQLTVFLAVVLLTTSFSMRSQENQRNTSKR